MRTDASFAADVPFALDPAGPPLLVLAGAAQVRVHDPNLAGFVLPLVRLTTGAAVFPLSAGVGLRLLVCPEPGTWLRFADPRAPGYDHASLLDCWLHATARPLGIDATDAADAEAAIAAAVVDWFENERRVRDARAVMRPGMDRTILAAAIGRALGQDSFLPDPSRHPLTSVFARVTGVPSVMAGPQGDADPERVLRGLARRARLRLRRVTLERVWWRREGEAMVGFRRVDGAPMALMPEGRGFRAVSADGACEVIDARVAQGLEPFAWLPERGFGIGAITGWRMARFGLARGRREVITVILVSLAAGLLALMTPWATAVVFDRIIPASAGVELLQLIAGLIAAATGAALFELVRGLTTLRLATRMNARLESAIWDRLLRLPATFFRRFTAGDLALRTDAVNQMRDLVGNGAIGAVLGGAFSVIMLAQMALISWRLALIALGIVLIEAAVAIGFALVAVLFRRQALDVAGQLHGLTVQLVSGVDKLRTAGAEQRGLARWTTRFGRVRRLERRSRMWAAAHNAFGLGWGMLGSAAVIACVGFGWAPVGIGEYGAFNAAFGQFHGAMLSLFGVVPVVLGLQPLYARARPILREPPEDQIAFADAGTLAGEIDMQGVTFRYAPDEPPVLHDVSLLARPGEFIAIVGPSGSGKSTLMRIMLGFETPEAGSVFFDGRDLAGLDASSVRRQIGVVLQSGKVFAGSLMENIAAGAPLTEADALAAVRLAGLADDIAAMPMGLHTLVTDGGGTLSGGQAQRVLLARAFARRPRIVLLDEATSALDNQTQAIAAAAMAAMNATRVVIAHRLSTVRQADRIYVMHGGRIVEHGTFDSLIAACGLFKKMADRQQAS